LNAGDPEQMAIAGLVGFLGLHVPDGKKLKVQHSSGHANFSNILNIVSSMPHVGANVNSLNGLAQALNLPWAYRTDADTGEANRHFAYFFALTTNIRFGVPEGQHRCFMINRVMQGVGIADATVPIYQNATYMKDAAFPENTTLSRTLQVRMLEPKEGFSMKTLECLIQYSKQSQKMKEDAVFNDTLPMLILATLTHLKEWGGVTLPLFKNPEQYWKHDFRLSSVGLDAYTAESHCGKCHEMDLVMEEVIRFYFDSRYFEKRYKNGDDVKRADAVEEAMRDFRKRQAYSGLNFRPFNQVSNGYAGLTHGVMQCISMQSNPIMAIDA
jgi:hypothetical protein